MPVASTPELLSSSEKNGTNAGRVAYRVKSVSRGRAKDRVMTSTELLARLSALLPPPRYPPTRYHGVRAPRSAWRLEIVPRAAARSPTVTAVRQRTVAAPPRPAHLDDEGHASA